LRTEAAILRQINLSARLRTVAGFIPRGTGVADIGTDHGLLPVSLALDMYPGAIFASDINEKPIKRARELARLHGVEDRITFLTGDGLDVIGSCGVDTVAVCGLGGETIARILSGADRLSGYGVAFVLQPQSRVDRLCAWLDENGFYVAGAALTRDRGRIYPVLSVRGRGGRSGSRMGMFEILARTRDPLLAEYIGTLSAIARAAAYGQADAKSVYSGPHSAADELSFLAAAKKLL
jgi:tRNA (adenine22-N1)-methyltransferase